MQVGLFRYKKRTLAHYVGARGLNRQGRKKWQRRAAAVFARSTDVLKADDVGSGGGNAKNLHPLRREGVPPDAQT